MKKAFFSKPIRSTGSLAALLVILLAGCAKDSIVETVVETPAPVTAGDRAPAMYGVTVWATGAPSKIVDLNAGTTAVVPGVPDLKGIVQINGGSGEYYVTTGANNPVGFQNRLLKVNPVTGAILATYGPAAGYGTTISDVCFVDVAPLYIYGLRNNTNVMARISYGGGTWPSATLNSLTGIAAGWVARGLTWTRNPGSNAFELIVTCTRAGGNAKVYKVNTATFACTFVCDLTPAAQFNGNNCGTGYFYFPSPIVLINRSAPLGLNRFNWLAVMPPVVATGAWGGPAANYEDLCSVVY